MKVLITVKINKSVPSHKLQTILAPVKSAQHTMLHKRNTLAQNRRNQSLVAWSERKVSIST